MKKITLLLLLLILPGFMVGQNLITNGGFETATLNTDIAPWTFSGAALTSVTTTPFNGQRRGNLGNEAAKMMQNITTSQDVTYQVSFYWRFNLGTSTTNAFARIVKNSDNSIIESITLPFGTSDWTYTTFTFTATALTTNDLRFEVEKFARNSVNPISTNNAMWFDNISIRKLGTFNGSVNSDFSTASNWSTNEVPTDHDVIIPSGQNVVLNGSAIVGNININAAASLTINGGGSLVIGEFGVPTGNITYNRTLQANKWHFVSPPVVGATYNDTWIADNGIASGQGNNRGISTYQNGAADPTTGQWIYTQAGDAGTFETSKGYSLRRSSTGTVSFTGTYPTGARPFAATVGSGSAFNLVGNPYPMYLSAANFFINNPYTNDGVTTNDKLSESTIWLWDQSANAGLGDYVQKTSGIDGAFQIAPGQAFFVSSGTATNKDIIFFQFNGTNQSDTFLKSEKTQAIVKVTSNGASSNTELYYLPEGTNDFDNGYDASKFTGVTTNFDIYTSQLSDGAKKLGRQVLSNSDMETLVVPVGVKATSGQEITFSAEAMNLPDGIKLFLEDRANNTITRLDEANSDYKVTLSEALDGTGRFFLHTKSSAVLGTDDVNLTNVSIFKSSKENLRIIGLTQGTASLKLYNVTGKQVLNTNFQSKGANDIALPKLATGVYIVQLQTENGRTNKKIILE